MTNLETINLFNKWAERIHDARQKVMRETGRAPEWLILSKQSWEELKAATNYMMRYSAFVERFKPSEIFGLKVAIIDTTDQSFDFMEVR